MIESTDEGRGFVCHVCVRTKDISRENATFRSARNASNMYSHFKHVHANIYEVLDPFIQARTHNKRQRIATQKHQGTIQGSLVRLNQRTFNEAMMRFFASPDVPKAVLENPRFKEVIAVANPSLSVSTVRTLNSRLWSKFHSMLESIRSTVVASEFHVLMFDVSRGHTADDVCAILKCVVQKRLGNQMPTYFLSDSAPVNKSAVRKLMHNDGGDDFWFPCSVHFAQLAMREAVTSFLTGGTISDSGDDDATESDIDDLDEESLIRTVELLSVSNAFKRLTTTVRAIRTALRRSHARLDLFETTQTSIGVHRTICGDVITRFDSTVDMFEVRTRQQTCVTSNASKKHA
eukprot:IDg23067t1